MECLQFENVRPLCFLITCGTVKKIFFEPQFGKLHIEYIGKLHIEYIDTFNLSKAINIFWKNGIEEMKKNENTEGLSSNLYMWALNL